MTTQPIYPKRRPSTLRLLLLLGISCMLLGFVMITTSCAARTTLYRNGEKIAEMQGDMTELAYTMAKDGSVKLTADTVDHSTATQANGQAFAAGGVSVAASGITTLLIK